MPPRLIGMVHLGPLPGSPSPWQLDSVIERAVADAATIQEAGFDALLVENYGDTPFFGTLVPPITVAAMTRAVSAVRDVARVPVGVNVLRNDSLAALGIAAATGSAFIRVNVLAGVMLTDQGIIEGRAAELARERARLEPSVEIYADVLVKHAMPAPGVSQEQAAEDTWTRAGADALILTGSGTGRSVDLAEVRTVHELLPDAPLIVGSGVSPETVAEILSVANGVIVGTAIKEEGVTSAPVSRQRAEALVTAAA